jgi:predicted PurR-regulated permease PerM
VQALPVRVDRKSALGITHAVQTELSRYLFTITVINAALGVAVGLAMWAVGMSNPILWGVIAAVFNFVPFLGALVGVSLSAIVALVTFDSLSGAMLAPGFYLLMTAIEGQFITPSIVGRRLEINSVAVLLSLAFWAWMWGIVGALMAVPILVAVRVLCNHVESLSSFGMFLASRGAQRESGRSEPIAGGEGKSEIAKAGDPG